jgi:hypothetical protein
MINKKIYSYNDNEMSVSIEALGISFEKFIELIKELKESSKNDNA